MSETQDVYNLSELGLMSFECRCGTEVTFQVGKRLGSGNPVTCPNCNENITGANLVLDAYAKLHAEATKLKISVKLRGPKQTK
jgi:hypothetical protein